jgi:hypothetical protein
VSSSFITFDWFAIIHQLTTERYHKHRCEPRRRERSLANANGFVRAAYSSGVIEDDDGDMDAHGNVGKRTRTTFTISRCSGCFSSHSAVTQATQVAAAQPNTSG